MQNIAQVLGLKTIAKVTAIIIVLLVLFVGGFEYNEAGYQTHVRTIMGNEDVVTDVGYFWKGFGRTTAWKQALTLQFAIVDKEKPENKTKVENKPEIEAPINIDGISSTITNFDVVFLGNVDASIEASTRFRLPTGEPFLKIAREYRTPDNFILTALAPAVKETLQSTASLMTADDYFAGARSEFASEFETQLKLGQYIIRRKEVVKQNVRVRNQPNALQSGGDLPHEATSESSRVEFQTEKLVDDKGMILRKHQQFIQMGVEVVEARITNLKPNLTYRGRMEKVQSSLADLAVARQNRLKEDEETLLVTARGEKEVEQKRQETLKDQIAKTTTAETEKKLAIIEAQREKEKATIAKETAMQLLEKAKIDAMAIKTIADAEAYAKKAILEADGALTLKLEKIKEINEVWARAASIAPVPSVVMGGSSGGAGRQSSITEMMEVMTAKAARDLSTDLKVK